MKQKHLKILCISIICIIASLLTEIFVFNFRNLGGKTEEMSYSLVSSEESKKITHDSHKTAFKLNLSSPYINKLIVNYETKKDVPYSLIYTHDSLYGRNATDTFNDIFDDSFQESVTNLDQNISDIYIVYDESDVENLNLKQINVDNSFHFNTIRFIIILLSLSLVCSVYFFYKSGFKTEKLHIYFVVISSILGAITILAQPSATFYSFDDQIHFQKVVDITGGDLHYSTGEYHLTEANVANSAGHYSVNSIEEQTAQNDLFNSGPSQLTKHVANTVPTYDKFSYLPMAIGYHLAKLVGLPFYICFIIGKFFNLLSFTLLIGYAIKTIKIGKRLLLVIALFPTNIFLASQYSYDPAVFSGITIFIAHLVNLFIDHKSKFDFRTLVIMLLSLSYACFTKAIYAPLLLLTLFIPQTKFKDKKQSLQIKTGLFAITLLLLFTFILPALSGEMNSDLRGGNTSVGGQLSLVLSHPFDYSKILADTALGQLGFKLFNPLAIGNFAYTENPIINISSNFFYIFLFILFFVFITDNHDNILSKKQRTLMLCINAVIVIFIWTALYLSYTPVGENTIFGVQDRYFLPLLFPILLCLQPKSIENHINPRLYNASIAIIPALITFICIIASIVIPYAN